MENKESRDLRKFVLTQLEPLVKMFREKAISELSIESGGLAISMKVPAAAVYQGEKDHASEKEEAEDDHVLVTANMVGIFHRASTPFEPALIEVGKDVARGEIIGYIESMRLKHELRSPCVGRVRRIMVEENDHVDFGKALMEVET